ncbi:MAG TPA: GNAT family N-acetyltransferase [Flavisolibacter sp.]
MPVLIRTDPGNPGFIQLVKMLDADLAERDGEETAFYSQFNQLDSIRHVVLAFQNEMAIACGAMKEIEPGTMEIKRMFTLPAYRGNGIASLVLKELETWATELNYQRCCLETGKRQPEAIHLYEKNGYLYIPNYGQYEGVENSVCFEKLLL